MKPEQERDVIPARFILAMLGFALLTMTAGVIVATQLLRVEMRGRDPAPNPSAATRTLGTIEQTQIESTEVGLAMRARERKDLERFERVDAGVARIPIDKAMDLVAKQKEIR